MYKVNRQLNILFFNSLTNPSPLQGFPAWSADQQFYPLFSQSFAILTQPMGGFMPHSLRLLVQLPQPL